MKMKYISTLAVIFLFLTHFASAQTAFWRVEPRYDQLEVMNTSMLKVRSGDYFGVIAYDGKEITTCSYTQITDFREGCVLLLRNKSLKGILSDDGRLIEIDGEYEVDLSAPFYSEGLLAVKNAKGYWGYLDKSGKVKVACIYAYAFPFAYGLAAVADGDYFMHINSNGEISYLGDGFNDDDLFFATTFTNSTEGPFAVIVNDKRRVFKRTLTGSNLASLGKLSEDIDLSTKMLLIASDRFYFNTDWSLKRVVGSKNATYEDKSDKGVSYVPSVPSVTAVMGDSGKYDLRVKRKVVLADQFDKVVPLSQDLCVVSLDGKYGVLDIFPDRNLSISSSSTSYTLAHNIPIELTLQMNNIATFDNYVLENVEVTSLTGGKQKCSVNGEQIQFEYLPSLMGNDVPEKFEVTYSLSGLTYPSQQVSVGFTYDNAFKVIWPSYNVILDSRHNAVFDIAVVNHSNSSSDECEIIIDGKSYGNYIFSPNQRTSIQIRQLIDIQDEDQTTKNINVIVRERGCPDYKASRAIVFERYFINN